jgi:hypothetical protein
MKALDLPRFAHDHLVRICFNDYDREIAIVAVRIATPEKKRSAELSD